jgi:hypothetical protein
MMMPLMTVIGSTLARRRETVSLPVIVDVKVVLQLMLALHYTPLKAVSKPHLLLVSGFLLPRTEIVRYQSHIMYGSILEVLWYLLTIGSSLVASGSSAATDGAMRTLDGATVVGLARRGYLRLVREVRLPCHALDYVIVVNLLSLPL